MAAYLKPKAGDGIRDHKAVESYERGRRAIDEGRYPAIARLSPERQAQLLEAAAIRVVAEDWWRRRGYTL